MPEETVNFLPKQSKNEATPPKYKIIYKIINLVNGRYYIGCTYNLKRRVDSILKYWGGNERINEDLKKYPKPTDWKVEVLEKVLQPGDKAGYERERYWIKELKSIENGNYNISLGFIPEQINLTDNKRTNLPDNELVFQQTPRLESAIAAIKKMCDYIGLNPDPQMIYRLVIEYLYMVERGVRPYHGYMIDYFCRQTKMINEESLQEFSEKYPLEVLYPGLKRTTPKEILLLKLKEVTDYPPITGVPRQ